jgi:hypothetical protein
MPKIPNVKAKIKTKFLSFSDALTSDIFPRDDKTGAILNKTLIYRAILAI